VVLPEDYFLFVRSGLEFALNDAFIPKEKIREERKLEKIYRSVFPTSRMNKKIGTELDILPADQFCKYKEAFPGSEFVSVSPVILDQRKRKDASEIARIKKACQAIHRGHTAVLETLHEAITELELAAAVENAHRLAGHEGIFFIRQPDFFMAEALSPLAPIFSRSAASSIR
jgi:Xaa-Pro dipeptidase